MRAVAALWRMHRWTYRASGGRLGGRLLGMPVLLLTTKGRRTGRPHTTALLYFPEGRNVVVIASSGGSPAHPAWWWNLRAHPEGRIQIGRGVRRREAEGPERERLWARVVRAYRGYAAYQARTSRRIPVVVLEPVD